MTFLRVLKRTFANFVNHRGPAMGAALAYYAIFSMGPMLLIAIAVAGAVYGEQAASDQIYRTLRDYLGSGGAGAVQMAVENAHAKGTGLINTLIGLSVLLFAATALFGQLQEALNAVWEVKPKPGLGIVDWLKVRLTSFAMVLGLAFLLLVSLVITTVLAAVGRFLQESMPGGATLWSIVNTLFSFAVVTFIFAAMFKVLPDAHIAWRDVWVGAGVTAALFALGEYLLSLYIRRGAVGSAHGAAGSLIIVLVWVYYASQIVLIGAEFTRAWACRKGVEPPPMEHAMTAPTAA